MPVGFRGSRLNKEQTDDVADLKGLFREIGVSPHFSPRPTDIPGDLRISWRLSILCLLLKRGRSNSLALEHLHVLWWAIRSDSTRIVLLRWLQGAGRPDELLVRFDPSLTVSLDLAIGAGLVVVQSSGALKLTSAGLAFADEVLAEPGALVSEKKFLDQLPVHITQRQIQQLLEWH